MIESPGQLNNLTAEQKRALLGDLLRKEMESAASAHSLSYGQQAMWYLYQIAPESSAYNVSFTTRIRSSIDVDAFERALNRTAERHEPLRSTFGTQENRPVQIVHTRSAITLREIDAAGWDDETLYRNLVEAYRAPFDLEQGPMLRACLFTRASDDHALLLAAHHIVLDGWALWVLLDDLMTFYAIECGISDAAPAPLAARFSDYVRWQQDLLRGQQGERMWAYWRDQLSGDLPVLDLPADRPRPPAQTFNGATHTFTLDEELSESVKELSKSEGTTPYTVLLAAFQVLLHRYSGQSDILVGSPMAGRSRSEFASMVGDFINMVVLRGDLEGQPAFRAFLSQMREKVLGALEHQEFPFPLLVSRLALKHAGSRSPIFQVAFDLQRIHRVGNLTDLFIPGNQHAQVEFGGLTLEPYPMPQQEGQLDLILQMAEAGGDLHGAFKYNTDLFDAGTIERMAGHFRRLLEAIVEDPDQSIATLALLTPEEQARIIDGWSGDAPEARSGCTVHQLIVAQALRTPEAIAIVGTDSTMTYGELAETANRIAQHLVREGFGRDDVVGICLERTPLMVAAVLGVLKSGAAYLPLDPYHPAERHKHALLDADACALVTTSDLAAEPSASDVRTLHLDQLLGALDETATSAQLDVAVAPDDLAYVIYTSGSTGEPKGVEVQHRSVANFLLAMSKHPGLSSHDVLAAVTTVAFDISVLELFLPLIVGAKVVLVDRETARDGRALLDLLQSSHATVIQATPVTFRLLLSAGLERAGGLRCLCGGEQLPASLARDLLAAGVELWNLYGPTEATVWATVHCVERDQEVIPVGRPIEGLRAYVLDNLMQVVPPGAIGELFIGGFGVARGYRNRPELTAERFLPDPFTGDPLARMYRTGDLARHRPDGTIVVLGRSDRQIKLRGFRIEPGEIEAVLSRLPGVREALVQIHDDGLAGPRLVAYLTTRGGERPHPGAMRNVLRQQLPDYMIPSAFVELDAMPLTANGKVDQAALPAPFDRREPESSTFVEPATRIERDVAEIWQRVLGLQRVSSLESFFDLGATSIQAVEVIAATEQRLGVRPNPGLLQVQTLGQFAATCDEMLARGEVVSPVPDLASSSKLKSAVRRMLGTNVRHEVR